MLLNLPPAAVALDVSNVFESVDEFFRLGGANLSLWPAFIAAVEAYRDRDKEAARRWLAISTEVGMGNRRKIIALIHHIWQVREGTAHATGQDPGSIAVDWRGIMKKLDLDILLV